MGSPGITSSDLVSQRWADSLSLTRDWKSRMRSILDLWGGERTGSMCVV